jgi:hypothetical protein
LGVVPDMYALAWCRFDSINESYRSPCWEVTRSAARISIMETLALLWTHQGDGGTAFSLEEVSSS